MRETGNHFNGFGVAFEIFISHLPSWLTSLLDDIKKTLYRCIPNLKCVYPCVIMPYDNKQCLILFCFNT